MSVFRSKTPFGHFFWVNKDFITSGKIIHYLILRQVGSPKKNEMWFSIGGTPVQFGKKEFALITGLNCGPRPNDETMEKHAQSTKLKKRIFKNVPTNQKITLKDIETRLASDDWDNDDDQFRLALVYFVEGILIAQEWKNPIRDNYLSMVEDLDFFLSYPWGTECFKHTIASLKRDVKKKARERKEKFAPFNHKETWTLYGFPHVLQVSNNAQTSFSSIFSFMVFSVFHILKNIF
ncbi:hypothetical protein UlMin_032751 [Ulmus minor]